MKKIAFVMNEVDVGGVSTALIECLSKFDYSKYQVTVWVNAGQGALQSELCPQVEIKKWGLVDSRQILISQIKSLQITSVLKGVFYRLLTRATLSLPELNTIYNMKCLPMISDEYYDCIICYQGISCVVLANSLYRLLGKKKVLWIHGDHNRPKNLIHFFSKIYGMFDKIFCVSETTRDDFCRQFPVVQNKTQVFYNLIPVDEILEKSKAPIDVALTNTAIVTVGRLSPEKGQQMIPQTTRLLLDAGYDVYWYLVGDGDLRETVESEIQKYDVAEHVILLGTQMNPYPYIKNCDIYVQTSLSEGWCLTVQEARILQKPIVTTPLPVMHEQIISGENGLIAEAVTPEALFEGIRTLLDHPELREKFVENLSHEVCDNSGELQKLYDFIES